MADLRLRINELPEELNPAPIDNIAIDGPSTRRTTAAALADAVRPYSTEAQARTGLHEASAMTPLRVKQAIEALGGQQFASAGQGNKADTAVQPGITITAGTGLTGGGTLAANRTFALSSTSLTSLALANTAVQPGELATVAKSGSYNDLSNRPAIPQGTVTSIAVSVPTGFSVSGSPVTDLGTISISYASGYQGFTTAQSTKLADIATKATANQTDAYLLSRANHTGAQAISTVTGLQPALDGKATSAQGAKADTAVQPSSLAPVATSGAYGDLTGKPALGSLAAKNAVLVSDITATGTPSIATFLRGDGSWGTIAGSGTVTSVGLSAPTGFSVSGSPVTGAGALSFTYASGYQGFTTTEATKLAGIVAGAQVNAVTSVAGRTGAITLAKADVSLANVDNTADVNKPVSTAMQTAINTMQMSLDTKVYGDSAIGVGFNNGNLTQPYLRKDSNSLAFLATQDQLNTKSGFYDGSDPVAVNLPVGANIGYTAISNATTRNNATVIPRLGASAGTADGYTVAGTGAILSGVWKHRGYTGQQGSTGFWGGLAQRTE